MGLVVLITVPRGVKVGGLRVELIPHSKFLIDNLMEGHISPHIRKVTNQIEQARESHKVPIDVFQQLRQVGVQVRPQILSFCPHAYSFDNFVFLSDIKHFVLEE